MAFIETPDLGPDAENMERVFALRPDVYEAWRGLVNAVSGNMDFRMYELATLAAARRLRSSYCSLAHGSKLAPDAKYAEQ
jgi:alkylhydroperoxidase family enzyme